LDTSGSDCPKQKLPTTLRALETYARFMAGGNKELIAAKATKILREQNLVLVNVIGNAQTNNHMPMWCQ